MSPSFAEFSYVPDAAFEGGISAIETIKNAIKSAFPDIDWRHSEPRILAIDMRSANGFTVRLNSETKLTAANVGEIYDARYEGTITDVKFSASTALNFLWVAWTMVDKY